MLFVKNTGVSRLDFADPVFAVTKFLIVFTLLYGHYLTVNLGLLFCLNVCNVAKLCMNLTNNY